MKLDQRNNTGKMHLLVYGAPKTGKTLLVGKMAEYRPIKYIGGENGITTLQYNLSKELQSKIDFIEVPDNKDMPLFFETCLKILTAKPCKCCDAHGKVGCSICAAKSDATFVEFNQPNEEGNPIYVFDSWTAATISAINKINQGRPDDYKMLLDDWGYLSQLMNKAGTYMQTFPHDLVVISHEAMVTMSDEKTKKIVPVAGSENFSMSFAKYFDTVVYTEIVNKSHKAGSGTDYAMAVVSGSRSNVKIEGQLVPNLYSIFDPAIKVEARPATPLVAKKP